MQETALVKKQMNISNNIPAPAEEEDETEKTKIEEEDLYTEINHPFSIPVSELDIKWPELNVNYSFHHFSKLTPPPKA